MADRFSVGRTIRVFASDCTPSYTYIGNLEMRYEGFVVDPANGQLWATQDGYLFHYDYPALTNTEGAFTPYYDDSSGNLSTGAPALDADGHVFYVDANVGGGDHQTLYKVNPGGSRTSINSRSGSGLPILDLVWNHLDGALYGAEQINPGGLYELGASTWTLVSSTTLTSNTGSSSPVVTPDGAVWRIIWTAGYVTAVRWSDPGGAYEYGTLSNPGGSYALARCDGKIVYVQNLDSPLAVTAQWPDVDNGAEFTDGVSTLNGFDSWTSFSTPGTAKIGYLGVPADGFTTDIYEIVCCGSTPPPPSPIEVLTVGFPTLPAGTTPLVDEGTTYAMVWGTHSGTWGTAVVNSPGYVTGTLGTDDTFYVVNAGTYSVTAYIEITGRAFTPPDFGAGDYTLHLNLGGTTYSYDHTVAVDDPAPIIGPRAYFNRTPVSNALGIETVIVPATFHMDAGDGISVEFGRTWTDPAFTDPPYTRPFKASPLSLYLQVFYLEP